MHEAASDPEISRYLINGPGTTLEEVDVLIELVLGDQRDGDALAFTALRLPDRLPVGMTRFLNIDRRNESVIRGEPFDKIPNLYCDSLPNADFTCGEGVEVQIRFHQLSAGPGWASEAQTAAGKYQRRLGYHPKIFVAPHEAAQPRVLQLLGAPQFAQFSALAGNLRLHSAITECTSNNVP